MNHLKMLIIFPVNIDLTNVGLTEELSDLNCQHSALIRNIKEKITVTTEQSEARSTILNDVNEEIDVVKRVNNETEEGIKEVRIN